MKKAFVTIVLMLLLLTGANTVAASDPVGKVASAQKGEQRTLSFPKDHSVGSVELAAENFFDERECGLVAIASAMGTVTVSVPPGQHVLFEANNKVFENPSCLNEISASGIDAIKLSCFSIDDSEDGRCDRALRFVQHFSKSLKRLNLDRSDATDAGISALKKMPNLQVLFCYGSQIKGACFKDFPQALPELSALNLSFCPVSQDNLGYLSHLPKLKYLALTNLDSNLDVEGVKQLSKCSALTSLRLQDNRKVNDSCVKYLLALKKLEHLDLRGTSVTMNGIKMLAPLRLKSLGVPSFLSGSRPQLNKLLPGTKISFAGKVSVDAEVNHNFAPLRY